jgi:threonine/homoserine/homoserine lactone efflux protein
MEDSIAFAVSAIALLIVPGPTNSLITASGGTSGFLRTVCLLPAELCGYMIAIIGWGLGLAAVVRIFPGAIILAKLVAGAILVMSARRLWVLGDHSDERKHIGLPEVFLVTMSNPKALIFALSIVPHLKEGNLNSALPYLVLLGVLILLISTGWSAIGAGLGRVLGSIVPTIGFTRAGAVILLGFALGLVGTALSATIF